MSAEHRHLTCGRRGEADCEVEKGGFAGAVWPYERDDLPCGFSFQGPAIVEQVDATTVVPPGASAEVDKYLNIIIRVKE